MTNFNKPYQAKTVDEFWKRWHISLSTWFKDYLYIPLGGNKVKIERRYLNLFIVFLISGLWHGANWTFIIWGALNGFYLVFGLVTKTYRDKMKRALFLDKIPALSVITTFLLISFAWIFFRANDVSAAFYIVQNIFTGLPATFNRLIFHHEGLQNLGLSIGEIILAVGLIVLMEVVHVLQNRYKLSEVFLSKPMYVRWATYYTVIFAIIYLGVFESRQFIYFQF